MENKFYCFDSIGYLVTLAASPVIFRRAVEMQDYSAEGGINIINQLVLGNYPDNLKFPVDFIVRYGRKLRNVIEIQYPGAFLISEAYKLLFEKYQLSGWKTYDVIVRRKNGEVIPGYYGFTVTGRCPVSVPDFDVFPDFFHPDDKPGTRIHCSHRVFEMLKENKIKDFSLYLLDGKGNIV